MEPNAHLEWKVPYRPGTLEARGWKAGKPHTTKIETTGDPSRIELSPDRSAINADGEDVSVVTVTVLDSLGREVPDAVNLIRFEIEGAGKIIGLGNGDPSSHEPDKCLDGGWKRRLFNGKCQLIVQALRTPGIINLRASSDGLNPAIVKIDLDTSQPRPSVGD
jgi:beta-galactosidase